MRSVGWMGPRASPGRSRHPRPGGRCFRPSTGRRRWRSGWPRIAVLEPDPPEVRGVVEPRWERLVEASGMPAPAE